VFLASCPEPYTYSAGTSYAAPHVAGALALLLSADLTLDAQRAVDILCETATDISTQNPAYAGHLGSGLINISAALTRLGAAAPSRDGSTTTRTPTAPTPGDGTQPAPPRTHTSKVNINTASGMELASLPLMGEWTAAAIVAYRNAHGRFASVEDLTRTGVIDSWTLDQIRDYLTVDSAVTTGPSDPDGSSSTPPGAAGAPANVSAALNINTATAEQFEMLPFIGEWTAQRIVEYRSTHGPFHDVRELTATGVIDSWTMDQIADLVMVA
jgi:competence ComEA-like helix-hairpin-helix protein